MQMACVDPPIMYSCTMNSLESLFPTIHLIQSQYLTTLNNTLYSLLVAYLTVTVRVGLLDHHFNLFIRQSFAQLGHNLSQFVCRDESNIWRKKRLLLVRNLAKIVGSACNQKNLEDIWHNLPAVMNPSPSTSNTLKASSPMSGSFVWWISCLRTISRNSWKSMTPSWFVSDSSIIWWSSSSVGNWPSDRITVPSSTQVMHPSPSCVVAGRREERQRWRVMSQTKHKWIWYTQRANFTQKVLLV